jgi:hypothetical protein
VNKGKIRDAIEELLKVHKDDEDRVLGGEALKLARLLEDFLTYESNAGKRMGRHARAAEREKQKWFDSLCHKTVEQFHSQGTTWTAAFEKAAEQLNVAPETVRKANSRGKKAQASRR